MLFQFIKNTTCFKRCYCPEEWDNMQNDITYTYLQDGYFAELKHSEMMRERVNLARDLEQYVGKYYSHQYVRSKILKQNELEQKQIDSEIQAEQPKEEPEEQPKDNETEIKDE